MDEQHTLNVHWDCPAARPSNHAAARLRESRSTAPVDTITSSHIAKFIFVIFKCLISHHILQYRRYWIRIGAYSFAQFKRGFYLTQRRQRVHQTDKST